MESPANEKKEQTEARWREATPKPMSAVRKALDTASGKALGLGGAMVSPVERRSLKKGWPGKGKK